jgi:hypothetical protein
MMAQFTVSVTKLTELNVFETEELYKRSENKRGNMHCHYVGIR